MKIQRMFFLKILKMCQKPPRIVIRYITKITREIRFF